MSRAVFVWSFLALLAMALSFGPSFAHLLEAPPRLTVWSPELWPEATVLNGQFVYFAIVGAPLDIGSILLGAVVTVAIRHKRPAFWLAMAATTLYATSLATWFAIVAPMNAILAQWGPVDPRQLRGGAKSLGIRSHRDLRSRWSACPA